MLQKLNHEELILLLALLYFSVIGVGYLLGWQYAFSAWIACSSCVVVVVFIKPVVPVETRQMPATEPYAFFIALFHIIFLALTTGGKLH
jgi:hypothetical protein